MAISLRVYPSVVYIDTASYSESGFIFIGEDGGSAITSVSIQSYTTDFQLMSTEGVVDRYRLRAYLEGNTDDQTTVKLNVTTTAGSGTVLVTVVRGLPEVRPFQLSWDKLSYVTSVRLASDATSAVLYNVSPYPFAGGFEVTGVTGVTNGVPTGSSWVIPITVDEGSISIKDAGTSEVGRATWVRVEAEDVYANPTAVCGYAEVSARGGSTPLDITVMQQVTHPDGSIETLYPSDYVLTATLLTSGISGLTVDSSTGRVTWPANSLDVARSCQVSVKVVANGLSSPTYTVTSTQKANVPEYSKPVVSGISYPDVAVSWRGGSQTPSIGRITQHVVYTNGTEDDLVITDYTLFSILPTEAQGIATMLDNGTTGVIEWSANDTAVERSFDVRFFITANGVMSDVVLVPSRQERGPRYGLPVLKDFSYDDIDSEGGLVYANTDGAYRDVEYADGSTERIQLSSASFSKVFAITSGSGARVNAQTGALTWATYTGEGIREIEVTATLTMNDGSGVGETVAVARQTPSADYDVPVIDSVTYANVDGDGGGSSPVVRWHQGVTYWDGSSEVLSGTRYAWDISSVSGSPTPEYADDGTVYLPANDTFSTRVFSVVGSITLNGMTSATYTAKVSQWGRSGYFDLVLGTVSWETASASAGSESGLLSASCRGSYYDGMGNTTTNVQMTWHTDFDVAVDSILSGGDYLESWSASGLVWKENTSTASRSATIRVYATTVYGDPRQLSATKDIIVYQDGGTAVDPDPDKQVSSYDWPVVSGFSYPTIPFDTVMEVTPTLTVTQKVNYTDGSSEVLTLGAGQYVLFVDKQYADLEPFATMLDTSTGLIHIDTTGITEPTDVALYYRVTANGVTTLDGYYFISIDGTSSVDSYDLYVWGQYLPGPLPSWLPNVPESYYLFVAVKGLADASETFVSARMLTPTDATIRKTTSPLTDDVPDGYTYLCSFEITTAYNYDSDREFTVSVEYNQTGYTPKTVEVTTTQLGGLEPMMVVTPESLICESERLVKSYSISWVNMTPPAMGSWEVTSNVPWLSAGEFTESGGTFVVAQNNDYLQRDGFIHITYTGTFGSRTLTLGESIEVQQYGFTLKLYPLWSDYIVEDFESDVTYTISMSESYDGSMADAPMREVYRGHAVSPDGSPVCIDLMDIARRHFTRAELPVSEVASRSSDWMRIVKYVSTTGKEASFIAYRDYSYTSPLSSEVARLLLGAAWDKYGGGVFLTAPISDKLLFVRGANSSVNPQFYFYYSYYQPYSTSRAYLQLMCGDYSLLALHNDSADYKSISRSSYIILSTVLDEAPITLRLLSYGSSGSLSQSIAYTMCDARSVGAVDSDTVYQLVYLNKYGGWDQLSVFGTAKRVDSISREGVVRRGLFGYPGKSGYVADMRLDYPDGRITTHTSITPTWELHTGFIFNERIPNNWHHLVESNQVYLMVYRDGFRHGERPYDMIPVNITNTTLEYKTYRNSGRQVYSYTINVEQGYILENR